MSGGFEHRGIVEGFYGPPWSHADRLWLLERMGAWGLNRYLYAPKDDPLHRSEWRRPYPPEALGGFGELVESGVRAGVEVGFAVSPGLSIEYASAPDRAALIEKLRGFQALGARFIGLCLDDVPTHLVHPGDARSFASLGAAHVALVSEVAEALGDDCLLWVVPTDYLGTDPTDYLEELATGVPEEVEIGWTGRTVVSPTITSDEARSRSRTLGRRLLVWDNYPVSDGPMRPMLHLGPFTGRDADLGESVSGFLLNPMGHARASAVALCTAAEYLRGPETYDPEAAWRRAVDEVGAGAPDAFATFAAAHRFSALSPDDRDPALEEAWRTLAAELANDAASADARAEVAALLEARADVADALRGGLRDEFLRREIEPWIESHASETRRMQAAIRALDAMAEATGGLARSLAFFALEGQLTRIDLPSPASYGPRRVLYPQLVSMREEDAGFGADPALCLRRNLADEMVETVERWAIGRLGD